MIDLRQLSAHPINGTASKLLRMLGLRPEPFPSIPLCQLAEAAAERVSPERFPHPASELAEVKEFLRALDRRDPILTAETLLEDPAAYREEIPLNPANEWTVLSNHLDGLRRELDESESPEAALSLLLTNVRNAIDFANPYFAPQPRSE